MAFSFSKNQEFLAYVRSQDEPRRIIIRNVKSGIESSVSINSDSGRESQVGWFIWSPYSENELLFYTLKKEWLQVYYLNTDTMTIRLINENWVQEFWFDSWTSENKLRFKTLPPDDKITEFDVENPMPMIIGTTTVTPAP